jgi:hypothetical protein
MSEARANTRAHGAAFALRVSPHAAERFVARVRPGLSVTEGARELARLSALGKLQRQAPPWLRTKQRPPFYLVLTPDIAIPVDVASDGSTYYARTVLTRSIARSLTRQQQRRRVRHQRRAIREMRSELLTRARRHRRRRRGDCGHRHRWERQP